MIEINGKSHEAHKVKLTKKDLKNLKKGEALIFICKEDNKAIIICMEDLPDDTKI
jgi:hypothetical protein|nr:MAG TPA: Intracellular delivery domain [Caudoviricetes sp.]